MSKFKVHSWGRHNALGGLLFLGGMTLFLCESGCAVLTNSQIAAVHHFAEASKGYGVLPGEAVKACADISERDKVLLATAFRYDNDTTTVDQLRNVLDSARKTRSDLLKSAAQLDQAVTVLDSYAKTLEMLASRNFTKGLQEDAVALGRDLDGAVKTYNSKFSAHLDPPGSIVAFVARGLGGMAVRSAQARLLKNAIQEGDALVADLCREVSDLCNNLLSPRVDELRKSLDEDVATAARSSGAFDLPSLLEINKTYHCCPVISRMVAMGYSNRLQQTSSADS